MLEYNGNVTQANQGNKNEKNENGSYNSKNEVNIVNSFIFSLFLVLPAFWLVLISVLVAWTNMS